MTALESRSPDSRIGRRPNEDVDSLVGGLAPTSPPVTHGEGHASQLSPANSLTQRDVQNHIDQLCEAQVEDVLPNTSPSTSRARPCVPACAAWSQPPDETSGDGIPNLLTSAPSRFAIDPLGSQSMQYQPLDCQPSNVFFFRIFGTFLYLVVQLACSHACEITCG